MFHAMTDTDVADVVHAVRKVICHYTIKDEPVQELASRALEQRHF
jgi:hypothetical protein